MRPLYYILTAVAFFFVGYLSKDYIERTFFKKKIEGKFECVNCYNPWGVLNPNRDNNKTINVFTHLTFKNDNTVIVDNVMGDMSLNYEIKGDHVYINGGNIVNYPFKIVDENTLMGEVDGIKGVYQKVKEFTVAKQPTENTQPPNVKPVENKEHTKQVKPTKPRYTFPKTNQ